MTVCTNPLCKQPVTKSTGVLLHAGPKALGVFCQACADRIQTSTRMGVRFAGVFASAFVRQWTKKNHPALLSVWDTALAQIRG